MTGFKCYPRAKSQNICKYVFPHSSEANHRHLNSVNTVKLKRFKNLPDPLYLNII